MNILQIKPLAERFGCTIDTAFAPTIDGSQVVIVIHNGEPHRIGTVATISAMTGKELQRIFESVSGVSLRDWWTGREAGR